MSKQIIAFDIGIKNMAYCIMQVNEDKSIFFKHLEVVNLNSGKNIQDIIDATIELLDEIINNNLKIDTNIPLIVLIESQMTSIMRCIQTSINTYFKIIEKYEGMQITTKYLSAKHKLSLINNYKDTYIEITPKKEPINKYKKNKLDSIHFTKWLLETKYKNIIFLNYYNSIKKKDDVSDAFLMCVYYIDTNE